MASNVGNAINMGASGTVSVWCTKPVGNRYGLAFTS